jgi:DNA-binding response OmpR family regulator
MRALVVDDREDVALGLALLLRRLGHTVQVAYKAQEALKKGADMQPDVVFLDIGLPDRSGYDVCKEMRRSNWGLSAFIVAVTGRNEAEDLIRAAHSGFDRHVGKPMEFHTLQEILHTVETKAAFTGPPSTPGERPSADI